MNDLKKITAAFLAAALILPAATPVTIAQEANAGTEETVKAPAPSLSNSNLNRLHKTYRVSPGDSNWQQYINEFRSFLAQAHVAKSSGSQIIKANPSLKDFRVKLYDVGGGRVWYFPSAKEKQFLFLQIGQSVEPIDLNQSINISGARIVRSVITKTKVIRKRRRRVRKKVVKVSGPKYLILAGNNRLTGVIWLKAYKPYDGSWIATNDPFSAVPPYLLNNVSGKVSFSGNNIVMSVAATDAKTSKLPKPNSTSYRIIIASNGGKFRLAGSGNANQPVSIITQFVQGLRNNRIDLAKAWLHDPKLISIPKYIGLIGKNTQRPYKLVAMATPKSGGPRYRLVTYQKHDLIIDIGRRYKRLAIKGLFIAPPDPLAQKLSGTAIGASPPAPASTEAANKKQ